MAWRPSLRSFLNSSCRSSFSRSFASSSSSSGGSTAYRSSMFRKPAVACLFDCRPNSCSFIGRVMHPVTALDENGCTVYTSVEVKVPSPFKILIVMRDDLAQMSLKYVKPDDCIYVHGYLSSFDKMNSCGEHEIVYKVNVLDLNYVSRNQTLRKAINSGQADSDINSNDSFNCEYKDRLRLWQIFFTNPSEWWDNRTRFSSSSDFRNKYTGERLRLEKDDPPWVRTQLELYDSKVAARKQQGIHDGGLSAKLGWKDQDLSRH